MKVNVKTNEALTDFLSLVAPELALCLTDDGRTLYLIQATGKLRIENSPTETTIYYQEKAHLFRGLVLWLDRAEETFSYEETPQFESIGPMLDLSRNGVMSVGKLKRFILLCSKMGLNSVMLYMEDTYEIPEYPSFGHYRGRYSQKELKALSNYAQQLGVALIPAIQTLAHLTNPLKWGFANGMRDTHDILLVGEEKTYQFLEAAIASIAESFQTKKIHIGMDEAHELGRGVYLEKHGMQDRFTMMTEHLAEVTRICQKYQLEPMMWSDMFFRIGSKTGDYYDPEIAFPDTLIEQMPEVGMVYWDYYHHEEEDYRRNIANHKLLERPVIFAGGVWTWNGLAPNYGKSLATTQAGLAAAKKEQVQEVYATLWGDDGAETPLISSLLGLQQFSEAQFSSAPDLSLLRARFRLFHGLEADDFLLLDEFDQTAGVAKDNPHGSHASKLALYQDLLFGLHEQTLAPLDLTAHYQKLYQKLTAVTCTPDTETMFTFYQQLAKVLSQKADLGWQLREAYQAEDREKLFALKGVCETLIPDMQKLYEAHRAVWFDWNNPFGFEILDLRYGGLMNRLQTTLWRLTGYLSGRLERLEEFEAPRLDFDTPYSTQGTVGRNLFKEIYSPSKISDV